MRSRSRTVSSGSRACCRASIGSRRAGPRSAPGSMRRKGFAEGFAKEIANLTRLPFTSAPNKFAELAAHDTMVELSGVLNTIAVSLTKIANDIRLLGSGPRCGPRRAQASGERAGQLDHAGQGQPDPGRNADDGRRAGDGQSCRGDRRRPAGPSRAQRVQAADRRQRDPLDQPAERLAWRASPSACSTGSSRTRRASPSMMNRSLMLVTALAPEIGYDNAAAIAKHAHKNGQTLQGSGAGARPGRRGDVRPGGQAGEHDRRKGGRHEGARSVRIVRARGLRRDGAGTRPRSPANGAARASASPSKAGWAPSNMTARSGTIDQPIPSADGPFNVTGTHRTGQPGPVRVGQIFTAQQRDLFGHVGQGRHDVEREAGGRDRAWAVQADAGRAAADQPLPLARS